MSSTSSHPVSMRYVSILSSYLCLGFTSDRFPSGFLAIIIVPFSQTYYMPALIFLGFIAIIILDEEHNLGNYSAHSFLHPPVMYS
jgi:hypothetical protein